MNLELIQQHAGTPGSILDVGAHLGLFYRRCRAQWPEARITCVEANPACEPFLKESGADYRMAVLWSNEGTIQFHLSKEDPVSSGASVFRELTHFFDDRNLTTVRLPCTTLDALFPEASFDLIKLDTQGSELEIIRGGWRLLKRTNYLVVEVSTVPYNEGAPLMPEVDAELQSFGFYPIATLNDLHHPETGQIIQHNVLYGARTRNAA